MSSFCSGICRTGLFLVLGWLGLGEIGLHSLAEAQEASPAKLIEGKGEGWVELGEKDFKNVNCAEDTWTFKDGVIHCTGKPTGVMRTQKEYKNFELVGEWRHLKSAGNSGFFVWTVPESLEGLKPGTLPRGIEVQVLDHGYATQYEERTKKKPDWFTTNGDVFPVGVKMTPFPPTSPNGQRSFPTKNLSKGSPEWNHYHISAVDGVVKLSVNGEQVSGGKDCSPASGYLCLESEGSPIEFKNVRIKELP
jgi:hypothetical protein